jgi:hypothetical protein
MPDKIFKRLKKHAVYPPAHFKSRQKYKKISFAPYSAKKEVYTGGKTPEMIGLCIIFSAKLINIFINIRKLLYSLYLCQTR